ncbi:MAG: Hsp20/alpha crystallin family protein [Bacteroidales bacterium]|nr:Hsp20/alpha crystallin family protein [Bacteroidales bacterium]MCF8350137.1 Hsp20/alpha crystallin family protein [Bacteroidales bacterium]
MKDKENEKQDNASGFDFLGIGGLFKGVEKLVDLAAKLEESGAIKKEGEINLDHLKKGMKGVYGFTVRSAAGGGKPTVETFGNIRKTPEGPKVEEEREPMTDVFDEKDEIVIIAEMPGIEKEDIKLELNDDILEIAATGKIRKYRKELLLSVKAVKDNMSHNYNNGILEIRIKK